MNKLILGLIGLVLAVVMAVLLFQGTADKPDQAAKPATRPAVAQAPASRPSVRRDEAFYKAVQKNDITKAKELLEQDGKLAQAHSGKRGETPLHHVRSVEMAELLLSHGADANARDKDFAARPVRWAANEWRSDVVKFLEGKAGADEDITYYCAVGHLDKLTKLLEKDRSAATVPTGKVEILGRNRSLLHIGAQYGQPRVCEVLIANGADLAAEGGFFNAQPLEAAAWAGFPEVVAVLIKNGADVDAVVNSDQGDHTALWWAALTGRKEIVRMLLDAGASVERDLPPAARRSLTNPYPGRALPPKEDYEAVIEMLERATAPK